MPIDLIIPISMVMGLVVFGLAAKWYVMPALAGCYLRTAYTPFCCFTPPVTSAWRFSYTG